MRHTGFSKVYLYDHNSTRPLKEEVPEHVASGFVHYIDFSATHRKFTKGYTSGMDRFLATIQGQAYKHCTTTFGAAHQFMGFIDFDEFLVIHDPRVTHVDQLLKEYEQHPGLSIYWILLGSSGHKRRPAGRVVDSYSACTPPSHKFNTQFKTFANTDFRPTMYSPHRAVFNASEDAYMVNEHSQRIQRGRNKNSTHARASVYHYVTKSLADFEGKRTRGGGAGVTRPKYYFELMNRYSTALCKGAQETRAKFCKAPRS